MSITEATHRVDVADMLAAVEDIRPIIEEHRDTAESARRLADPVYQALIDSGLMGMTAPKVYGGSDLPAVDLLTVWEAVARIDPAVGWNLVMNSSVALFAAHLPEAAADAMFANGYATLAGAFNPPGMATRVEGGWKVDGQIPFASGCANAAFALFPFIELRGGEPVLDVDSGMPLARAAIVPMANITILDTWHTLGMRGTGSADMLLQDVFVDDAHAFPVGPLTAPNSKLACPLARMFPLLSVHGESVVSIAVAAEAVERLLTIAAQKAASYTAATLRDREYIQILVGKAKARVDASRSYLHQACGRAYDEAAGGSLLSDATKVDMQLAACFAAEQSAEAVRLVHEAAGTSGIRVEAGLERLFRDAHTLTQHASKAMPRYGSAGRLLFGLPNDWIFLSF
jgi:alkylation response protein AidB-like acyl-CoA dehydrogenase